MSGEASKRSEGLGPHRSGEATGGNRRRGCDDSSRLPGATEPSRSARPDAWPQTEPHRRCQQGGRETRSTPAALVCCRTSQIAGFVEKALGRGQEGGEDDPELTIEQSRSRVLTGRAANREMPV